MNTQSAKSKATRKPRTYLSPSLVNKIATLSKSGMTQRDIQRTLGISLGLVSKALARAVAATAPKTPAPQPEGDGSVNADEGGIEALLTMANRLATEAAAEDNLAGVATIGRLQVAIVEHQRKAKASEQEGVFVTHAQMQDAAAKVRKRMHDLADMLVHTSKSGLAPTISRLLAERKAKEAA